ncbi:MAG TPA: tellurite resistance/C4-dicarboxylate transporter family protein [Candidatus Stackebrandtia faecavium]|nr:tellurite resistance/C4-dicarboxylate transporter family protein [Candidatus Stackebrandtia faecavium]
MGATAWGVNVLGMYSWARSFVATFPPGYFALVMASGIVSVGLSLEGFQVASRVLLALAVFAHLVFSALTAWRFVSFRAQMVADMHDPRRAFGFFTFVAGTNVIGVRLATESPVTALILLAVSAPVGILLGYAVPWVSVLGRAKRPIIAAANGTWFTWVVASQSVAVLAAAIEPRFAALQQLLAMVSVMAWSVGVILYASAAMLVVLRLMWYPVTPLQLNPPYWVSMGAMAITVVAGAKIIEMDSTPMVDSVRGLIAGLVVVFWCFATWLIPVLIAAGVWRHLVHRIPFRYDANFWSMVFPLGMYAVAGIYLGRANTLPIVEQVGHAWLWVAVVAWLFTAGSMAAKLLSTSLRREALGLAVRRVPGPLVRQPNRRATYSTS